MIEDIPIQAPLELDLKRYLSKGIQHGEELLPEENSTQPIDTKVIEQLMEMGFTHQKCINALKATKNTGAESAMQWLFEHMDDPGISLLCT